MAGRLLEGGFGGRVWRAYVTIDITPFPSKTARKYHEGRCENYAFDRLVASGPAGKAEQGGDHFMKSPMTRPKSSRVQGVY